MTELTPGTANPVPADIEALVARIADEFEDRRARGEHPDPEDYAARHPEAATLIRDVLGVFRLIAPPTGAGAGEQQSVAVAWGRLGDFRLVREFGRGGMGIVYEAEQISLGRRVALKVLPFGATIDPRRVQRFEHEARAAALLHHEHIVPVYAVGSDRGVHYYAMQFIDGRTVADLIADVYGPVATSVGVGASTVTVVGVADTPGASPSEPVAAGSTALSSRPRDFFRTVAGIAADAADALEHAHALGVVHRDVKPGNLLLDASGKVWVTDFGLARLAATEGVTLTGDMLGTLRYMAPEQAMAKHDLVDHRADIYSLGATLYELLTGAAVVGGLNREEVLRAIAFSDAVALRKRDRSIPRDLETVVLKCLEKDPARRYASAKEFADDLRRYLNSEPVRAKRPTRRQRLAKWAGRNRGAVTTAAVAGVILLVTVTAGAAAAVWQAVRATDAKRQAQERSVYARRTVDEMYTRFAERWLSEQPQLTEVQREFLLRALEFYEEFARETGDDPAVIHDVARAHFRVGVIQLKLGRHEEAEEALRRAVDSFERLAAAEPKNADSQWGLARTVHNLGVVYSETGRSQEAEAAYGRAIAIARERVRASADPGSRETLAQWLNNLAVLMTASRRPVAALDLWREALGITRKLTKEFPDVSSFRHVHAVCLGNAGAQYRQLGRLKEAEEHLRDARAQIDAAPRADRKTPRFRAEAGMVAMNIGIVFAITRRPADASRELEAAQRGYEELVADFPQVSEYRTRLAKALMNRATLISGMGQLDEAVKLCWRARDLSEQLVADHPGVQTYEDARRLLGVMLTTIGGHLGNARRDADARALFEEAVRLNPEHAGAHQGRGLALRNLGQLNEAIASLREALRLNPNNADTHYSLGQIYHNQGKLDDAATCYRRAIELNPIDAEAHVNLGAVLCSQQIWDQAEEVLRMAICIKPEYALAHENLGKLLMGTGRPTAATESFRAVIQLQPGNANARYEGARAAALAGVGRGDDAGPLDSRSRAALRRQALDWLTAELDHWSSEARRPATRAKTRDVLREWQTHPYFAGVRDEAALTKLPDGERAEWRKLWAQVAEVLGLASPEPGPSPRMIAR